MFVRPIVLKEARALGGPAEPRTSKGYGALKGYGTPIGPGVWKDSRASKVFGLWNGFGVWNRLSVIGILVILLLNSVVYAA